MTYDEAIAVWFGRINYEVRSAGPLDLKLERMRALLRLLGDPHERLRIVHITGTKGKGSTSAMVAAVLRAAGYRVGLFTSPHLVHVEERIQVNGVPIGREELTACMEQLAVAVRELDLGPWPTPTFFEISTALGFLHFVRRRVEIAILEVGLGGRYDSTNVCNPLVSVITSVGFDHMAQLGNTLDEIAVQKAGIIKRGVPVVSGVTQPKPRRIIELAAQVVDAELWQMKRDFDFKYQFIDHPGLPRVNVNTPHANHQPLEMGLLGEHQAMNAAVAIATLDRLRRVGLTIPDTSIAQGIRTVHWPARIEVVSRNPMLILDSAHNMPSVEALIQTLRQSAPVTGLRRLVFAVSSDKQYDQMLIALAGFFDHLHLTKYGNNPRCVPPEKLAEILMATTPAKSFTLHATAADAWQAARTAATPQDLICIAGSVFLAGELSEIVRVG